MVGFLCSGSALIICLDIVGAGKVWGQRGCWAPGTAVSNLKPREVSLVITHYQSHRSHSLRS